MNRKKEQKLVKNRDLATSEFISDKEFLQFKKLYSTLKRKYKLTPEKILQELEKKEVFIPTTIFSKELSALETIIKYLKENLNLKNREISLLTGRSSKVVWQAYNSSKKKFPKEFLIEPSKYLIPVSVLRIPKLSVLEAIVSYLKDDLQLSYQEISEVLKRDHRTIWTIYSRARKKNATK